MITQKQLRTILDAREAESLARLARDQVLSAFKAGEPVEPGPLSLVVDESEQRRLNWDAVEQILGLDAAKKLRANLPAATSTIMKVINADAIAATASKRQVARAKSNDR